MSPLPSPPGEGRGDERRAARFREQLEAQFVRRKLDEGIQRFNDSSQEILQLLDTATPYFQGNPRELKRFVNAFRFHYFLWYAHRARGFEGPSLGQLVRWTTLTMKWPEVVRWLRRGSQSRGVATSNAVRREGLSPEAQRLSGGVGKGLCEPAIPSHQQDVGAPYLTE